MYVGEPAAPPLLSEILQDLEEYEAHRAWQI